MRNYIKWILMFFGLARGNIVGGFIGFIIGYIIEEALSGNLEIRNKQVFKEDEVKYNVYQANLLALISEVVKADGYITKEEVYYIKSYLLNQFGSVYSNMMLKTLKLNVDKNFDVEVVTVKLRSILDHTQRINLVKFLHGITIQKGAQSSNERNIINYIAKIIGLSQSDYDTITSNNNHNRTNTNSSNTKSYNYSAYKILGISENVSDAEVKKAYRQMVLKYHPDKSDAEDEIANEKFNAISEAYHIIKKQRNIK